MRAVVALGLFTAACAVDVESVESSESDITRSCAIDGRWEIRSRMVVGADDACVDLAKRLPRYAPETMSFDGWRIDAGRCEAHAVALASTLVSVDGERMVWTPVDRLAHFEGHSITLLETATLGTTQPCTMRVIYGGAKAN